jgi:thioredoxin 2
MIRACPSCGTKNRIPAAHLAHDGKCGKCKAALPPVDEPIEADAALFDEIVKDAKVPVLVDFWATWCPPCRAAAPHVKSVAHEMKGRALVLKVDTDRNPSVAAKFGVRGIPNFVVLRAGQAVHQSAGLVDAATMASWLKSAAS